MMTGRRFRWCFIGTGTLADCVAGQLAASGRHEIVSCYTRSFEKGLSFAGKYGCAACRSAEEAIAREDVDGVYVVTPHNAHYRYARMALELGKPVLCEKAFTVTSSETDELIRIAREKGLYLCEAMWTWFSPAAIEVKKWVDSGKIGRCVSAEFTYRMRSVDYAPRVSDPKRAGGALLDITVYPLTYAYRLWGMPSEIVSSGMIENGIDTEDVITMSYPDGMKVDISASIIDSASREDMLIRGENGTIQASSYHAAEEVVCLTASDDREVFRLPDGSGDSYLYEFDTAAEEIRQGRTESERVPLKCTSDVMYMMDAIREQIGLEYDDLE